MSNAYLAINYNCNENCLFCPCSKREKQNKMITPLEELKTSVDSAAANGITDLTISGGEPTLHPGLTELVRYIQEKEIGVTLLSNSERFSDETFLRFFLSGLNTEKIKVITTLHSGVAAEHELANLTRGSFSRTVDGLQKLSDNGVRIIIKHCITKANYRDLNAFYRTCDSLFAENIDIQLCSIDYCGITKERLGDEMLTFMELRPYLENLFDLHLAQKVTGNRRQLYCINMPLCSCDVYYWSYIPSRRWKMYSVYKDPHRADLVDAKNNVGISKEYCKNCKAVSLCRGTYFSAFDAFGDRIIKPF